MPSSAGPDSPIRLVSGGDRRLSVLRILLAVAGLLAVWVSGWPLAARLLGSAATLACLMRLEWRQRSAAVAHLVIDREGRATLDGRRAELLPAAWLTPFYAVVRLQTGQGRRHLLLSATRQVGGEYRKLLTWLRWQARNSH